MIEVVIRNPATNVELARIEIKNSTSFLDRTIADYSVRFVVERGSAVGVHQRGVFNFPRTKYNVLALLTQALATLTEKELELERGFDPDEEAESRPSDMARRLSRIRREIQGGTD